jgi:hypothetical protein
MSSCQQCKIKQNKIRELQIQLLDFIHDLKIAYEMLTYETEGYTYDTDEE